MNRQEDLRQTVASVMWFSRLPNLRGVTAEWRDEKAWLNYYFEHAPSEDEQYQASELSTEVVAGFWTDWLNVDYITLSRDHPLPPSEFWAYKRADDRKDS